MRLSISFGVAAVTLMLLALFPIRAVQAEGSGQKVWTVLKDANGRALGNLTCSVTHEDGSQGRRLRVGKSGTVEIQASETGILLCKTDGAFHGAKLVDHQGGVVNLVPFYTVWIGNRPIF